MPPRGSLTVGRIKTLRRVALGVAALLVLVLAVLWWFGREPTPEPPQEAEENAKGAQEVGKGFDHTVTHEGRPLMRIRGKRDRRDKEGNLHVDEVLITAYQEDGSRYEVTANSAIYSLDQKEAQLTGRVTLTGPDGFLLKTRRMNLKDGGHWVEANQSVEFKYGEKQPLYGRTQQLHAQINRGEFFLTGGVRMHTEPDPNQPGQASQQPFTLDAQKVIFERQMHQIHAENNVQLGWGDSTLTSDRLAAHLAPDTNKLQFVRAHWKVKAVFNQKDEQGHAEQITGEGDDLATLLDDQGKRPTHIELRKDGGKAHMRRTIEGGETMDLLAPTIEADLQNGRVNTADAEGGIVLDSSGAGPQASPRHLTAKTAHALFASGGGIAQVELKGGVQFAEKGQGTISGQRAVITPERSEVFGEPVVMVSERGELKAPRVVYTKQDATVHAVGGVEGLMQKDKGGAMQKTPLANTDEPVRVEAEEGFWNDLQKTFLFKGKVRAWSGDRVLRADQLRGDDTNQSLAASGSVDTVWFMPPPEHPQPGTKPGPRQVRVDSDTLAYSDRVKELIYEGNVRVVDEQRTLRSRSVTVDLDEKGQAKKMLAVGDVKLDAPAEGRSIVAETADYDVAGQMIIFHGVPVTVKDQKGGNLSGKQAVYSMETGKVKVTAEEGAAQP